MNSYLNKLLRSVEVREGNKNIEILGINGSEILRSIKKQWNTNKISKYMFKQATWTRLVFDKFFAPDVYYIFDTLIKERAPFLNLHQLQQANELLLKGSWLSNTNKQISSKLDFNKIKDMIYEPLDYQMDVFKDYDMSTQKYNLKGKLLHAAAGTGKTYMGLSLANMLDSEKVLVICPNATINNVWVNEGVNFLFKTPRSYWVAANGKEYNNEQYLIVHYEALNKLDPLIQYLKKFKTTIILDESHNLNELTAQRTIKFIQLCKDLNSKDVILLSGTPVKALGSEMIPLFKIIDPYFTDEAAVAFKKIYGSDASRGLDILQRRLGNMKFVVEKSAIEIKKPIIEDIKVVSPLGYKYTLSEVGKVMKEFVYNQTKFYNENFKDYKKLFDNCLLLHSQRLVGQEEQLEFEKYKQSLEIVISNYKNKTLDACPEEIMFCNRYEKNNIIKSLPPNLASEFKDKRTIIKYMSLKIQGECLGRILGRKRIECHIDMVESIDFDEIINNTLKKTIIFSNHTEVVDKVNSWLIKKDYNPIMVYSKNKATNNTLSENVNKFAKDPDINPLITTFKSLSTGVPLIMADTMIMIDSPYRSYIEEQAISRIYRLGQDSQTKVFRMILDTGEEPNVSSRTIDILEWSKEQVEAITGLKSPFDISEDTNEEVGMEAYQEWNNGQFSEDIFFSLENFDDTQNFNFKTKMNNTNAFFLKDW